MRRLPALFVASTGVCALVAVALGACSTSPKLVGAGGDCFQATDCEEGLVCIPQSGGKRVCSSDLTKVQTTEEAGGELDADTDGGEGGGDGPQPTDAPITDAPQDTNPPPDTAPPPDTGAG